MGKMEELNKMWKIGGEFLMISNCGLYALEAQEDSTVKFSIDNGSEWIDLALLDPRMIPAFKCLYDASQNDSRECCGWSKLKGDIKLIAKEMIRRLNNFEACYKSEGAEFDFLIKELV